MYSERLRVLAAEIGYRLHTTANGVLVADRDGQFFFANTDEEMFELLTWRGRRPVYRKKENASTRS